MERMRLLADTNFWLAYLLKETGFYEPCARILEETAAGNAELYVAPTTVKDVFYMVPRRLRRMDAQEGRESVSYRPAAWACIEFMLDCATPVPLSMAECEGARMLRNSVGDFEDGLILAAAERAEADYVLTFDRALLAALPEIFITPARCLELLPLRFPTANGMKGV